MLSFVQHSIICDKTMMEPLSRRMHDLAAGKCIGMWTISVKFLTYWESVSDVRILRWF